MQVKYFTSDELVLAEHSHKPADRNAVVDFEDVSIELGAQVQ